MKINYFDSHFQDHFIENTTSLYLESIESFRSSSEEVDHDSILSLDFQHFFSEAVQNPSLSKFSSCNWYWLGLITDLVYLISLHDELEIGDGLELTPSEDELFNFWHDSDYAKDFLVELNESKNLEDTSLKFKNRIEDQIQSYYYIHINGNKSAKLNYQIIPEIGDGDNRVYSLLNLRYSDTSDIEGVTLKSTLSDLEFKNPNVDAKDIFIHSSSKAIDKDLDKIKHDIQEALQLIEKYSPKLKQVFYKFTKYIVPINEPGVVSYSMQSLPYFSSLNVYERDFTDLLDDLLHENGHHFMNFILNSEELIYEDDEKIYFSPWRHALRPIRGIYHAYFTFYWAFKLFYDLQRSINSSDFDKRIPKAKVLSRLLEEATMLHMIWEQIEIADSHGKITDFGMKLIMPIKNEVSLFIQNEYEQCQEQLQTINDEAHTKYLAFISELKVQEEKFKQ